MKVNQYKVVTVDFGEDRFFSVLLEFLDRQRFWSTVPSGEDFYSKLMNCREIFGIPSDAHDCCPIGESEILENGAFEIEILASLINHSIETKKLSILPQFISIDCIEQMNYAQLMFELPMKDVSPIPARTWLNIDRIIDNEGVIIFDTPKGKDRVGLDLVVFGNPPAGTVIYGAGERIL